MYNINMTVLEFCRPSDRPPDREDYSLDFKITDVSSLQPSVLGVKTWLFKQGVRLTYNRATTMSCVPRETIHALQAVDNRFYTAAQGLAIARHPSMLRRSSIDRAAGNAANLSGVFVRENASVNDDELTYAIGATCTGALLDASCTGFNSWLEARNVSPLQRPMGDIVLFPSVPIHLVPRVSQILREGFEKARPELAIQDVVAHVFNKSV